MDTEITQHVHPRRRRRLGALLLLSLVSGSLGAGALSLAVFTDTKASSGNIFTTGTVVLGVAPTSAVLTSPNMLPGDVVNGTIVVSNTGTAALRYAMTSAWVDGPAPSLSTQMVLAIEPKTGASCVFDASALYNATASLAKIGDPTQGGQAGDRTLAAGVSETLCFQMTLPLGTGNTYQNKTTTGTFTFAAEQTANN